MDKLSSIIRNVVSKDYGVTLQELKEALAGRICINANYDADYEKMIDKDLSAIFRFCGVDEAEQEMATHKLAIELPMGDWSEYGIPTVSMGAWLYVYKNYRGINETKNVNRLLNTFNESRSILSDVKNRYMNLITPNGFKSNVSHDSPQDLLCHKYRRIGEDFSEEFFDKNVDILTCLFNDFNLSEQRIVEYALDMPKPWIKALDPVTPVMAAKVMCLLYRSGQVTDSAVEVLGLTAQEFKDTFPEAEQFVEIFAKYDMDMDLGPFGVLDEERADKVCDIKSHVKKLYGSNDLASIVKLMVKASMDEKFGQKTTLVDALYDYINETDTEVNVSVALDTIGKDMYTRDEVAKLLQLLGSYLECDMAILKDVAEEYEV